MCPLLKGNSSGRRTLTVAGRRVSNLLPVTAESEIAESIRRRLGELGVAVSDSELDELVAAYPALVEWIHLAEVLAAGDPDGAPPDSAGRR
jgi:hypothetical protein